jgi:cell wall-associated NlpC family hydrolase
VANPPPLQVSLAQKYGKQYGVDPRLLLAIGGHETQWGGAGAGRPSQGGFVLGYGVTDSGILNKYRGIENQYRYGASTLANWGVHGIADIMAGKASRWATDPAWERGVQSVYGTLNPKYVAAPVRPASPGAAVANVVVPGRPRSVVQTTRTKPKVERWTDTVFDPGKLAQGIFQGLATGQDVDVASLIGQSQTERSFSRTLPGVVKQIVKQVPGKGKTVAAPTGAARTGAGAGLVQTAAKQLGQPYVWGAESRAEGGFDCSGLIDWAARQRGYSGPRLTTWNIAQMGKSVKGDALKPGDLVISNGGKHVSIYAGNGKCLVSPHTGSVVQYQNLNTFAGITDVRRVNL